MLHRERERDNTSVSAETDLVCGVRGRWFLLRWVSLMTVMVTGKGRGGEEEPRRRRGIAGASEAIVRWHQPCGGPLFGVGEDVLKLEIALVERGVAKRYIVVGDWRVT